jgi:hypothetical protein
LWDVHSLLSPAAPIDLGLPSPVARLTFSADSRWLIGENYHAVVGPDTAPDVEIRLWALGGHTTRRPLRGHRLPLPRQGQLAFDETGRWLLIATPGLPMRLFDLRLDNPVAYPRTPFPGELVDGPDAHLQFSPDGRWLVRRGRDEEIDLSRLTPRGTIVPAMSVAGERITSAGRTTPIERAAFSRDARWLAIVSNAPDNNSSEGRSGVLRFHDLQQGDPRRSSFTVPAFGDFTSALSFSSDGAWVAAVSLSSLTLVPLSTPSLLRLANEAAGGPLSDNQRRDSGVPEVLPPRRSPGAWLLNGPMFRWRMAQ